MFLGYYSGMGFNFTPGIVRLRVVTIPLIWHTHIEITFSVYFFFRFSDTKPLKLDQGNNTVHVIKHYSMSHGLRHTKKIYF